jgi:CARDB protein
MISFSSFKQGLVLGGLALSLLAAGSLPQLGGDHAEAAKKKAKAPNIAVQSVVVQPSAEVGHDTIVVTVANVGKRDAAGFRIGMVAQRADMTVRAEDFSLPLSVAKGATTTVEFRLGCNWINNGAVTARTDPSPVPGEPSNKTANNVATAQFGATACS